MTAGTLLFLAPVVMIIAGAYASVGLGGATSYLAIMSLCGVPAATMTPAALLLNSIVSITALLRFGLAGRLQWRLLLPFLVPAVPAAFLGGLTTTDRTLFNAILAIALAIAAVAMFFKAPKVREQADTASLLRLVSIGIPAGAGIGFISGFLGIGGGVFLGPVVLFSNLAGPRQIAAMNSVLILVLSVVGLAAHGISGKIELTFIMPLATAALIGAICGVTFAEKKISSSTLQRIFAVIIFIAALKAAFDAIFKSC
ncbi:MAG: sulfite exporter TauE/SafE family protein [Chitinivibrionales bacterium]|nr:sulfite exporter TauE/SafE family protein [Chitinivibrionales bacterium]